jgi:formate/nitrite transporter
MDYVKPVDSAKNMLEFAAAKAALPVSDFLIRGFLSGAILGFATTVAFTATKQTSVPLVGALVFPVGFILIILLGLELVTGNFALLPVGLQAGRITVQQVLANFGWVFLGNLLGSLFYGYLLNVTLSYSGISQASIAPALVAAAEAKTIGYAQHGMAGMVACVIKAVLCNWMVCVATIAPMGSTSATGQIFAAWIPIFIFFSLGFEHSVVNLFLIPTGMMLGAKVNIADWWLWNQIPVTIGNLLGGWLLIGLPMYLTYGRRSAAGGPATEIQHDGQAAAFVTAKR